MTSSPYTSVRAWQRSMQREQAKRAHRRRVVASVGFWLSVLIGFGLAFLAAALSRG